MNIRKLTPKLILVTMIFGLLYYFGALEGLTHYDNWRPMTNAYTVGYIQEDNLHMSADYYKY